MSETNPEVDAFSPENIGVVHFIQNARNYDVLMALLTHFNESAADALLEIHSQGHLVGGSPTFSGTFLMEEEEPTGEK